MLGKPRFSYYMADSYEKLLDQAYKEVKPIAKGSDRFEIPETQGHLEGNKTIINNFKQIADYLRRKTDHLLKFLQKELATSGAIKGDRLVLTTKVPKRLFNEKIESYVGSFVKCKECGKPDTELQKQDRVTFIHCLACGAKHSAR